MGCDCRAYSYSSVILTICHVTNLWYKFNLSLESLLVLHFLQTVVQFQTIILFLFHLKCRTARFFEEVSRVYQDNDRSVILVINNFNGNMDFPSCNAQCSSSANS